MRFSLSRFREVTLYGSVCVLALVVLSGCATTWTNKPPPCPIAPNEAIDQAFDYYEDQEDGVDRDEGMRGDPLLLYLGEIERYCDAIEALRE